MTLPDLANQYCHFFDDDAFEPTERSGFRRRVITGEQLQLCFWRITGGASARSCTTTRTTNSSASS